MHRVAGAEGLYSSGSTDEDEDVLAVTFDQLPGRWQQGRRDFDWSGGTNYTAVHRKVRLCHTIVDFDTLLLSCCTHKIICCYHGTFFVESHAGSLVLRIVPNQQ